MKNNATNKQCLKCCIILGKGFTLIEILIAIAIMAIISGAIIGRILSGIEKAKLQAAGRQVVSHIRLAQERAKLEQRMYTADFNATNETYAVYQAGGSFDGSGDFVKLPSSSLWSFTGDFAIEMWVNRAVDGSAIGDYYIGGVSTSPDWQLYFLSDGRVNFWRGSNIATTLASSVPSNTWTYVVLTRFGSGSSNIHIYINGTESATGTFATTVGRGLNLWIGIDGNETSEPFNGLISEVRIYNRALTAGEISFSYTYKAPQNRAGLVGWWKLDEAQGTSAADLSGNNNVGTLTGATWTQGVLGYLKDPAKNYANINYDFDTLSEFSGVAISSVDFDGTTITNSSLLNFDSLGRPKVGTESLSANGSVVLTCGNQTLTITVNQTTGEVTMQ